MAAAGLIIRSVTQDVSGMQGQAVQGWKANMLRAVRVGDTMAVVATALQIHTARAVVAAQV